MLPRRIAILVSLAFLALYLVSAETAKGMPVALTPISSQPSTAFGSTVSYLDYDANPGPMMVKISAADIAVFGSTGQILQSFGLLSPLQARRLLITSSTLPLFTLNINQSMIDFEYHALPGAYRGAFSVYGLSLMNGSFELPIRVQRTIMAIPQGLTAIPEPTTMLLLGTGVAGLAMKARRRRKVGGRERL